MGTTDRPVNEDTLQKEREILVLVDPTWVVDKKEVDALRKNGSLWTQGACNGLLKEAKVGNANIELARSHFDAFATSDPDVADEPFMVFDGFHRLNALHEFCRPSEEEHFFRAMDPSIEYRLNFQRFLLGSVAASPATPHILNSFTGYFRARFIFDRYNVSRSGALDFEEAKQMLIDARIHMGEGREVRDAEVLRIVQDLGELSVVTLRISGVHGLVCDMRCSRYWTGLQVRRELEKLIDVSVQDQQLFMGSTCISEQACVKDIVPEEARVVDIILLRACSASVPATLQPVPRQEPLGLERLVHVRFERFYEALETEELRGTSRLFRHRRSLLHERSRSRVAGCGGFSGALGGA